MAPGWRAQIGPAIDLYLYERLLDLGWGMALRVFKLLASVVLVSGLLALTAASLLGGQFLRDLLGADLEALGIGAGQQALMVGVVMSVAVLYLASVYAFREAFSRRRDVVSRSGKSGLFRALDLDARAVLVAYAGLRIGVLCLAATAVQVGALLAWRDQLTPDVLILPTTVTALVGLWLLVLAARNALGRPPRYSSRWQAVFLLVGGATAGMSAALLIRALTAGSLRAVIAPPVIGVVAVLAIVATGGASVLVSTVRRLPSEAFRVVVDPQARTAAPSAVDVGAPMPVTTGRMVAKELARSPGGALLRRCYLALLAITATTAGAASVLGWGFMGGLGVAPATRTGALAVFVLSLLVVEGVLAAAGPLALRRQLRTTWEHLAPMTAVVGGPVAVYLGSAAGTAALVAIALAVVTGHLLWWLPAIPIAVVGAALIGEGWTTIPRETADGSGESSLFVGATTVVMSLPVVATAAWRPSPLATAVVVAGALLLVGGGMGCTAARIRRLPSPYGV